MNPMDMLRSARERGYGAAQDGAEDDDGEEKESSSRSFPIVDGEKVPDGPCCLKVYGQSEDGKFVIDRIEPEEGESNEDAAMGAGRPPLTFS